MKAFSLDLRERAVALCDAGELKRVEIARLLDVSTDWLRKLLRQRRRLGHFAALERGGGRPALLSEVDLAALQAAWAARPDASLGRTRQRFARRRRPGQHGHDGGPPRACSHGADTQKKTRRAAEADEEEREGFRDLVEEMPHGRFLFVDETGVNLDLARTHARAPKGERAVDATVPRNTPTRTGLVGAMGTEGILCSMQVEGAVDGAAFLVFVEQVLGPHLREGDFVVLDNLNTHTNAAVEAAVYQRGAFLLFLPRYSPDLNPIEGAWSKLKAHLRRVAARTAERLDAALAAGLAAISPSDARGWFRHAGYVI